jgi:hypothetical protein
MMNSHRFAPAAYDAHLTSAHTLSLGTHGGAISLFLEVWHGGYVFALCC